MSTTTDLEALAATPEGRAQMSVALARANATEAQAVLDMLVTDEVTLLVTKLKLYAERAGDSQVRAASGYIASAIETHRVTVQSALVSAQLAAGQPTI